MKRWMLNVLLPLTLIVATYARAEEKFDPAAQAKLISPFIDEQTLLIVRIDLTRLKVVPLVDDINRLLPQVFQLGEFSKDISQIKQGAQQRLDPLLKAGAKQVYFLFGLSRMASLPVIVPLDSASDEKAIITALPSGAGVAYERVGDMLVWGRNQGIIDGVLKITPDPRPELSTAFEAAGDTAVQVVFTPPKHFKRVIDEIMPQLPKEIGGGESAILTKGCLWAALGIDLPPQLAIKLIIQSQDADSASALRVKCVDAAKFASRLPDAKKLVPNFMELAESLTPKVEGNRLVLSLDDREGKIGKIISSAQRPIEKQRENTGRYQSMRNLKMIGLAMHNYHDAKKCFPPAAIYSKEGKPLLSWRVMILPWMEQTELYKQFHLDEPWDSPNNIKLIDKMPPEFCSPTSKVKESGRTNYVVPLGPGTVFEGKEGKKIKDIKDGLSKTIMAVEVDDDHAVIWTKPDDLNYDPKEPAKGLGGHFKDVFLALICDGSVRAFPLSFPAEDLRAWFTAAGREATKMP